VWKFTQNDPHRTCTLYSNGNVPFAVSLTFQTDKHNGLPPTNAGVLGANPQGGAPVPHCTLNDGTTFDPHCMSGSLWWLDSLASPSGTVNGNGNQYAC